MIKFILDAMYYQIFIFNRDKFILENPHERTIQIICGILFKSTLYKFNESYLMRNFLDDNVDLRDIEKIVIKNNKDELVRDVVNTYKINKPNYKEGE